MQNVISLRRKRSEESQESVDLVQPIREVQPLPEMPPAEQVRPDAARSSVRVERVDLGPLAWLAFRCALIVTTIGALGTLLLWSLADAGGQVGQFESFMRSIGFRQFHIASDAVLLGMMMIIAGVALALAAFVVLTGAAYNLLAARGSGIRLRIAAAPPVSAAPPVAEASRNALSERTSEPEISLPSVGTRSALVPNTVA